MRILFVTEQIPYPLDSGGRIRSFHTIKSLAKEHEVILLGAGTDECLPHAIETLGKFCSEIHSVPLNPPRDSSRLFFPLERITYRVPLSLARHYKAALADRLKLLLSKTPYDVVHFDHLDGTIYSHLLPPATPTVLDEHNIVTQQLLTTSRTHPKPLIRLLMRLEASRVARYEKQTCAKQAFCLVCSNQDRKYLQTLSPLARIFEIPNGVDLNFFAREMLRETEPARDASLVFVGTLDYLPCDLAIQHFLKSILPIIHKTQPSCRFYIVGNNPSNEVRRLASSSNNVILTGKVPDVRPYLASSHVCVVPILSGSGTRLKILEAMAMQIPVVSTTIGAEGLRVHNGENILLADSAEEFAQSVVRLIDDAQLAQHIRENGLKLVREHYGWDIIARDLLKLYSSFGDTRESAFSNVSPD